MSEHAATVSWSLTGSSFAYQDYSRDHQWNFDEHVTIAASAAPQFLGDDARVDPEQAFVATVSSCHMLTFLAIASRQRITVLEYIDHAVGWLEKNPQGRLAITRIELRPHIRFEDPGQVPAPVLARMHARAHQECFIANSVTTRITVC